MNPIKKRCVSGSRASSRSALLRVSRVQRVFDVGGEVGGGGGG